ncbi:hypothetical protein JJQ72_16395 [Paenibacillus sp. F411]|uniref:Uncharacterized protein n=1 Tax=Paenibacillus algicola TaxID=2565926 RepID=A0A4P8XQY5_9BACL|nr:MULTISPECIES: hypothetical protein [Paenibacillus]MBO2945559.1 hypothetical protein [Paenibacillus sp. F411]QCT04280.1 hypothetical protein E6C60_3570 [Paenibacillus algicola]
MTYVNTSEIDGGLFLTVMLFLLVIAPLFSLAIMKFFQGKKRTGFILMGAGVSSYVVFTLVTSLMT